MSDAADALLLEGNEHNAAGRFSDALDCYISALALDRASPNLRFNIANVLRSQKRFHEAIAVYDDLLAMAPRFSIAHHNKSLCLLQLGDLPGGFREYEWRKSCPGFIDDERYTLERPWRGEDLNGKRLFIFSELFQGDLIQFCRYALLAEQRGAQVTLSAPSAMHTLLRTMSSTIELISDTAPAPEYDVHAALMSLPALFGTSLQTVPRFPNYLQADPERIERWRRRIGPKGFKIGLAWQGSARLAGRSFPLALAAEYLAGLPGVRLISLQKHLGEDQVAALPEGTIETLGVDFDPGPDAFIDTAAAMACCDLFLTPDTSVVHLAGALGVKTWLALSYLGDWRWLEGVDSSVWYPSARIFRQTTAGDWRGVFAQIEHTLREQVFAGA